MNYSNLTMCTDLYELTMMQGYFLSGAKNEVVFDLFYRQNPCGNGFAIAAGLASVIDYIKNLHFSEDDIKYLKSLKIFTEPFLEYCRNFKFNGEIYAVPEGTVVFPNEPILRVKGLITEAQLLETTLLNIINHQSLIATKASRVVWAAGGDGVLEFGLRRAQGPDAGIYGARAAVIAGCSATSNVLAGKMFNIPVRGTHAHSWVMSFGDELTAFREYIRLYPDNPILLVDTYDTLKSGIPNAITVFNEMKEAGKSLKNIGIRLDSGDFAYLSKKAYEMLKAAGFPKAIISASGDLDEYLITSLKIQGAKINLWGVGTNLITSQDCPAFGGVYKIAAETTNGIMEPRIKLSENPQKVTNPGIKKVFRLYDKETGKIKADLIAAEDETLDSSEDLTIFDPLAVWKRMTLRGGHYDVRELLVPVFVSGKCVYEERTCAQIRDYCKQEQNTLWDEHRRLINPHTLPVDLSQKLYDLKENMIKSIRGGSDVKH